MERATKNRRQLVRAHFAPPLAAMIRAGVLTTERALRGAAAAYEELGCDELILVPCGADLRMLELAADAALQVAAPW